MTPTSIQLLKPNLRVTLDSLISSFNLALRGAKIHMKTSRVRPLLCIMVTSCNREEPNLTTCWICFFYFNLCFPLLLFSKRIQSIYNGLPQGTLPLCLNVKPKCLCSGKHPDPVHLWMAARKKKLTHPLPEAGHSRGYLQNLWPFYFTSSSPPPFCSIKETGGLPWWRSG